MNDCKCPACIAAREIDARTAEIAARGYATEDDFDAVRREMLIIYADRPLKTA